jgi:hypothetical protein
MPQQWAAAQIGASSERRQCRRRLGGGEPSPVVPVWMRGGMARYVVPLRVAGDDRVDESVDDDDSLPVHCNAHSRNEKQPFDNNNNNANNGRNR